MTEVWKDIEGYEGVYQVSNFGQIKSLRRKIHNYNMLIESEYGEETEENNEQ